MTRKPLTLTIATLALSGALLVPLATTAMADESSPRDRFDSMTQAASDYGFDRFNELSIDDGNRFEAEGWHNDGTRLDVDLSLDDGSVLREQRNATQSQAPEWSLSAEDVGKALDSAQASGIVQISSIDADGYGHIEVEGYDDQHRELELNLARDSFEVTSVNQDD